MLKRVDMQRASAINTALLSYFLRVDDDIKFRTHSFPQRIVFLHRNTREVVYSHQNKHHVIKKINKYKSDGIIVFFFSVPLLLS